MIRLRYLSLVVLSLLFAPSIARLAAQEAPGQESGVLRISEAKHIVQELVDRKLRAMKAKDIDAYLAILGNQEKEYFVEQRNWFLIYQRAPVSDFATMIEEVKIIDQKTIQAKLRDTFSYGTDKKEQRDATYEKVFRKSETGWKDCDLNFLDLGTDHFVIKYPKDAKRIAPIVAADAEKAYESVTKQLGLDPTDKTLIKLYVSREMVRHSSDISVEWLFSGWYEYGESIKFFAYPRIQEFSETVAHGLTHKITIGITDSMALWLAEGIAESCELGSGGKGNALKTKRCKASEISRSLNWLAVIDLWSLPKADVSLFYNMSGMVVEFLKDTYGQDKVMSLLKELAKNPRYDRGYDPKTMEAENQRRTEAAIQVVYGISWEDLDKKWLSWISEQR